MRKFLMTLAAFTFCFLMIQNVVQAETDNAFLDVDVTSDKENYDQGDEVQYTITITNQSANDAEDVVVTAELPDGLDVIDSDAETEESKLIWSIEQLKESEQVSVSFAAKSTSDNAEAPVVKTASEEEESGLTAPQTGDDTNLMFYGILLVLSIGIIIFALWMLRSKRVKKSVTFILVFILIGASYSIANAEETKEQFEKTYSITVDDKTYEVVTTVEAVFDTQDNVPEEPDEEEPENPDIDGDGLTNAFESRFDNPDKLHPEKKDSDGNGVDDGDEDYDNDGLTNLEEQQYDTNPFLEDTDGDGLSDKAEVEEYNTDPTKEDTDGDGLPDGLELEFEQDPTNKDTDGDGVLDGDETYEVTRAAQAEEGVSASVELMAKGKDIPTLKVEDAEGSNANVSADVPGYVSAPFNFEAGFDFDEATMTFTYDETVQNQAENGFEPAIYYFNEDTGILEKVAGQTLDPDNGTVTVTVEHFSTYLLLNERDWKEVWNEEFVRPRPDDGSEVENLDMVLTIDSSGSMSNNDPQGLRKTAANNFVDTLLAKDQGALVDFDSRANVVEGLSTNHEKLKEKINNIGASGGTNLNNGLAASFDELMDNGKHDKQYVIFLTDGVGDYNSSILDPAVKNNITVYTIGLGSGVNENDLEDIANRTGGEYFFASTADELIDKYKEAAEETTGPEYVDTDGDGISDYEEENGYFLMNVGRVTTDPNDPDTDGDGIKDGDELGEFIPDAIDIGNGEKADAYMWHSRPDMNDTDGDGLNDKKDPEPLVVN